MMIIIVTHDESIPSQNILVPELEQLYKKMESLNMWNAKEATAHPGQFWAFPEGKKKFIGCTSDVSARQSNPLVSRQLTAVFPQGMRVYVCADRRARMCAG